MRIRPLALVLAVLAGGCPASADPPQEDPREAGEAALKAREWEKAERLLSEAAGTAQEGADEVLYLLAVAQSGAKRYDEAIATLDRLVKEVPGSALRRKALFRKADLRAAKKDFAGASELYEDGIVAIADPARRGQIARVYVEAAREHLRPDDPTFEYSPTSARDLLMKALELEALGEDEEGARFDLIECERAGKVAPDQLIASCREFEEKFPASSRLDEVLFIRGGAEAGFEAERTWVRLADRFPDSKRAPEGLLIAAGNNPRDLRKALRLWRRIVRDFPSSDQAPAAAFAIGFSMSGYEELREEARKELLAFIEAYPTHERVPEALMRVAEIHREEGKDGAALEVYESFLRRFPDSPRWPEVRSTMADIRYARIQVAESRKEWSAVREAAVEFERLLPADHRVAHAAYLAGEAHFQEAKFREAVEAWTRAASKYPDHPEGHRARLAAARTRAEKLDEHDKALKELEAVGSDVKDQALKLIEMLKDPSLEITSERTFREGEIPTVRLVVRNLEKVRFRLWTLDVKDYFAKRNSTRDLQGLEVSIIAPEVEWDLAVPGYRRYKEFIVPVELPRKAPGAYVMLASAGEFESKTVVLVSDVALFVRAGPREFVAAVQNMRTGERVDRPEIFSAADGKRIQGERPEGPANILSFFAESGGHVTFADVPVQSSVPTPSDRAPKALILTDRSIYAPGDRVQGRILVRDVVDGFYAVPQGKKHRLAVSIGSWDAFFTQELTLSPSGAVDFSFCLLPGLPHPVLIRVFERTSGEDLLLGTHEVVMGIVPIPSPRVEFLLDEKPRFSGDRIELTAILRDEGGRPMGGRSVGVSMGSGGTEERITGPDGAIPVVVEQDGIPPGGTNVHITFGKLSWLTRIPILSRGVNLEFDGDPIRDEPILAGEEVRLGFSARRADDSPVSRAFRYAVSLERDNRRTEVISGEASSDEGGRGTILFTPPTGGLCEVTLGYLDEEGIPTHTRIRMAVFDEKDEKKILILSPDGPFEAGKPLEVPVFSRIEKGLVFVTVEGEKIRKFESVVLEKGRNRLHLGLPPAETSTFTVTVSAMRGTEFHEDAREFRLKPPPMRIELSKAEAAPGEEVTVSIVTIPESEVLLIATEGEIPHLASAFFHAGLRTPRFVSASSVSARFSGLSSRVDPTVLSALERLEALDNESGVRVMMPAPMEEDGGLDVIGGGGGGGGAYGGRHGGRRNLVASGGGGSGESSHADPAPILFTTARADAKGRTSFSFKAPFLRTNVSLAAWAVDRSNAIASGTSRLKVRAPVIVDVRAPGSVVEGEKTSIVAIFTNYSDEERETVVSFEGEHRVKVPARSSLERAFEWMAAESAVVLVDGVAREVRTRLRPASLSERAEAGGVFSGRVELSPEGEGKITLGLATGLDEFLESLSEEKEPFRKASSAAAELIARAVRHRRTGTGSARETALRFRSLRAAGIRDETPGDASGEALLYLAEAEAKAAGLGVEPVSRLVLDAFSRVTHDDLKAFLLFVLARGGDAPHAYLHRLWRTPEALSPRALACVALAFQRMGKIEEAKAAVDRLAAAVKEDHWEAVALPVSDGSNTTFGVTALGALALAEVAPEQALLPKVRAWLLGRGPSAPSDRALLAMAMGSVPDGGRVKQLKVGAQTIEGHGVLTVDKAVIEAVGEGTFYALASRSTGRPVDGGATITRHIGWPALRVEGQALGCPSSGDSSMTRVAAGETFAIQYGLGVKGPRTQYSVLELPEITGLRLRGGPPRVLLGPQGLETTFQRITLEAYADAPGSYPAIEVLPAGADFRGGWRITHAERLAAGRILAGMKKWSEAKEMLAPLFESGTLSEADAVEAARLLTTTGAELKDSAIVVDAFEVLKEKAPDEVVSFKLIRAVGAAYATRGEHERALQIRRGTCDAYFFQEALLPGELEALGRIRRAGKEMERLLLDHPDTDLIREMHSGFGTRLVAAAHKTPDSAGPEMSRTELHREGTRVLERHRGWYPEDPQGDRIALTLGSAYFDARDHVRAERTALAGAELYPSSGYLDGFDYTVALARFGQKRFDEALQTCDRLETFDYGSPSNPGPGVMRDRAILMKAQIYHARGEIERALENYKKLEGRSADADLSVKYLMGEALTLPEMTSLPLSRPAEVEIEYSGIATVGVRVYKVDLTALTLRRKGVWNAGSVEIAGIHPVFEREYPLAAPKARVRERQKLALDLGDPGAYWVTVRSGDFSTSGLVLRSDLVMGVQEEDSRVRVNVTDVGRGGFAEGVKVTIFGTHAPVIASDKTDLRGVWEREGVEGLAVVVAEREGHVAFYRGQSIMDQVRHHKILDFTDSSGDLQTEVDVLNEESQKNYRGNLENWQKGVKVEQTK